MASELEMKELEAEVERLRLEKASWQSRAIQAEDKLRGREDALLAILDRESAGLAAVRVYTAETGAVDPVASVGSTIQRRDKLILECSGALKDARALISELGSSSPSIKTQRACITWDMKAEKILVANNLEQQVETEHG